MTTINKRKTVAECRIECDLAGGDEYSELEVVYTQRAVVSMRKTVADHIKESEQAYFIKARDQVCYNKEDDVSKKDKVSVYTQMQNHYDAVVKEAKSSIISSASGIYIDWYEGESPYPHISPEQETIMDDEVPPPVRDFEGEEKVGLIEEDERKEKVPSWEDEFGDELVGLPVLEEEEEFDPVGDLAYLEKLLAGIPTVVITNSPNEDEHLKEEFDSRPVEEENIVMKLKPRTREKAKKEKIPGNQDRSPHYILRIRFGPGIYKFWLSDLFKLHKTFSGFIIGFIINNDEQINYNGLDRGWIKEKPPD